MIVFIMVWATAQKAMNLNLSVKVNEILKKETFWRFSRSRVNDIKQ